MKRLNLQIDLKENEAFEKEIEDIIRAKAREIVRNEQSKLIEEEVQREVKRLVDGNSWGYGDKLKSLVRELTREEMNDRYLFRAKRIDNREWIVGDLSHHKTGKVFVKPLNGSAISACEVDKDTICQCTGLKDKNGKLIWENDIILCKVGTAKVIWNRSEWRIEWLENDLWRKDLYYWAVEDNQKIEVIGNIFDNPELMHE